MLQNDSLQTHGKKLLTAIYLNYFKDKTQETIRIIN